MARPNLFRPAEALAYVLGNDVVLWNHTYYGELRQLLAYVWPMLNPEDSLTLTKKVLDGPSAALYRSDLPAEDLAVVSAEAISERLSVLEATGRPLPADAAAFLGEMRQTEEQACTSPAVERTPLTDLKAPEIVEILQDGLPDDRIYRNQWVEMVSDDWCRTVDVLGQLRDLSKWPVDVWVTPLNRAASLINTEANGEDTLPLVDLALSAPDDFFARSLYSLTLLLDSLPRLKGSSSDGLYWRLWDRTFAAARSEANCEHPDVENPTVAMNTPVGRLTEALFERVNKHPDADTAEDFWKRLDAACAATSNCGRAARCLAARRLGWLFSKRPEWTGATLLPLFDWICSDEARLVWQSFLLGAGLSTAIWDPLRKNFLASFEHTDQLSDEPTRVLYHNLGRIAVHEPDWLTHDEAQRIVTGASHTSREQIAWVFWRNLEAAGERAGALWRDRIGPWLAACWQADEALKSEGTSQSLIRVALSAGDALPEAAELIVTRLLTLSNSAGTMFEITRSKAPERFPKPTLKLLDRVIDRRQQFYKGDLEEILKRIERAWPDARKDSRFLELSNFAAG